jgi:hypothetical protein
VVLPDGTRDEPFLILDGLAAAKSFEGDSWNSQGSPRFLCFDSADAEAAGFSFDGLADIEGAAGAVSLRPLPAPV